METLDSRYLGYLCDESKLCGQAEQIVFPDSPGAAGETLRTLYGQGRPYTIQGARTGISGGAVPFGGVVVSTERMAQVAQPAVHGGLAHTLEAWCGARLEEVQAVAAQKGLEFRPNPTETTATVGGLFACRAAGTNAHCHGSVAQHVRAADILLPDGTEWRLERGQYRFDTAGCSLPDGRRLEAAIPKDPPYRWGFTPCVGTDLLDLFAGSEGVLGLATRFELALYPRPPQRWSVLFFFGDGQAALEFLFGVIETGWSSRLEQGGCALVGLEYLDGATLAYLAQEQPENQALGSLPRLPAGYGGAVLLDLEGGDTQLMETVLAEMLDCFENMGGTENDTWAAMGGAEVSRFHAFRHAVPEVLNTVVGRNRLKDGGIHKLCLDLQLPGGRLDELLALCRSALGASDVPGALFAHALVGRVHVNLLPGGGAQLPQARALLETLAARVAALGGGFAGENGVGKARRDLFLAHAPGEQVELMRRIQRFFDPKRLINRGNIL